MKSNIHIVIVDDSSTNNLLCKILFEEKGYKVSIIDNGREAIQVIKNAKPNIILLDIMMPDVDGLQVLENLKSDETTKNIPIIIVSASETEGHINAAKEYGILDYVKKPIGLNDLLGNVEKHLKNMNMI